MILILLNTKSKQQFENNVNINSFSHNTAKGKFLHVIQMSNLQMGFEIIFVLGRTIFAIKMYYSNMLYFTKGIIY